MPGSEWMKPNQFDDDKVSPTKRVTSGSVFATGALNAKVTGGTRYQAIAPEKNGGFSKVGHREEWPKCNGLDWAGGVDES